MYRKTLLPAICAGMALGLATAGWAQTPPDDFGDNPPVRQDIGMLDTVIALQEAADCRVCHTNTVNLHHMEIQEGKTCLQCHTQGGQGGFVVQRDCTVCHTTSPHHQSTHAVNRHCTECHGDLVADYDDGHYIPTYAASLVTPKTSYHGGGHYDDGTPYRISSGLGFVNLVELPVGPRTRTWPNTLDFVSTGINNDFIINPPLRNAANKVYTVEVVAGALGATYTAATQTLVVSIPADNSATALAVRNAINAAISAWAILGYDGDPNDPATLYPPYTYAENGGLPVNNRGFGAGSCSYCHDDDGATDVNGDPAPVLILNNHDTHHNLNWPTNLSNGAGGQWRRCNVCHDYNDRSPHLDPSTPTRPTYADVSGPGFDLHIRICAECHSPESLHRIQADSDDDGDVVVGGELMGYGHVGKDGAPGSSDCWGCHGFDFNAGSVPFAGPTVPTLYNTDISTVRAGKDTTIILAGASFTNTTGGQSYEADVRLTDGNGVTVTLQPELVLGDGSLAVKIPGRTRPGNYRLQAVKGDVASNPVSISVTPVPRITRATYQGTVTIIGSGFGGYAEGSPTAVTATVTSGIGRRATTKTVTGTIVSWTDSKIVVNFAAAPKDVTVTSVFGTVTATVAK